eukprot:1186844-Prorocentrum_minimum.AAC.3
MARTSADRNSEDVEEALLPLHADDEEPPQPRGAAPTNSWGQMSISSALRLLWGTCTMPDILLVLCILTLALVIFVLSAYPMASTSTAFCFLLPGHYSACTSRAAHTSSLLSSSNKGAVRIYHAVSLKLCSFTMYIVFKATHRSNYVIQ